MRNFFVGMLWLWLLASLGVYGYRVWRRMTQGSKADRERAGTGDEAGAASVASRPTDDVPVVPPTHVPPAPVARSQAPSPSPRPGASPAPPVDRGGRGGLFAPAAMSPRLPGNDERPVVADVLQGISLPCDLAPLVDPGRVFDPCRVAFVTDHATPSEVGAGLGDELERLGFSLATLSDTELEATKDDRRVTVTIHPDPSTVTFGAAPAFPNLPAGSVVVEFRT